MEFITKYHSPIGMLTLVCKDDSLSGIWFDDKSRFVFNSEQHMRKDDLAIFEKTKKWLDIFFSGKEPNFTPKLTLDDLSPFQKIVCERMLTIPFGETITYGEIARQIEEDTHIRVSAQAVGGAVGRNPISIIIPCHRVVGKSGNLTGYAGGLDKKIFLLECEGIDTSKFTLPKPKY